VNKPTPKTEWDTADLMPEATPALLKDVLDHLEQGILVWSKDQRCVLFNERLAAVLELPEGELVPGQSRQEFLAAAVARGDVTAESAAQAERDFNSGASYFTADRHMPSGRVLAIETRRLDNGGFVTAYTDVTQSRRNAEDLITAKQRSEKAETRALKALAAEQTWRTQTKLLSELGEWLQCCKSLEELYQVVSVFMAKLLPQSKGELYIFSNSRDVLDGVCSWSGGELHDHIVPDACWHCAGADSTAITPRTSLLPAPMWRSRKTGPTRMFMSASRLSLMATRSG
jgi:hypothetical protein